MTIDISPMSAFLNAALYLVGIPAIILSIVVFFKITRSFYGKKDYELEIPDHETTKGSAEVSEQATAGPAGKDSTVHRSQASPDAMKARMIQSG
jgi:hypothetical protein